MKLGTQIKRITNIDADRYRVGVEYTDGFRGTVDLGFIFRSPGRKALVLEILRGQLFARCFVEAGALAWPNGYELCPDAIATCISAALGVGGTSVARRRSGAVSPAPPSNSRSFSEATGAVRLAAKKRRTSARASAAMPGSRR